MLRSCKERTKTGRLPVSLLQNGHCPRGIAVPLFDRDGRNRGDQIPDHFPDFLLVCAVLRKHPGGRARTFLQEAQKDMLGSHIPLLHSPGGAPGKLEGRSGLICKLRLHYSSPPYSS